jgi:hypothetical protein
MARFHPTGGSGALAARAEEDKRRRFAGRFPSTFNLPYHCWQYYAP